LTAFKIFAFVFPLGLDTLAISIALGLRGFRPLRPALLFTLFETAMPLFGIALAQVVSQRFATAAVIAGGILLISVGVHAMREAMRGEGADSVSFGSLRSTVLAGLAISTDEIAAGFPMGVSGLPIAAVLATIAVQTLLVTALGVGLGNRVRASAAVSASRWAGIAAGIAFAAVGLWLILERVAPYVRAFVG
jgi:manganese efflux pump family protein